MSSFDISALLGSSLTTLQKNSDSLSNTLERLSSGLRIDKASDDAAALGLANSLRASSVLHGRAVKNISEGISYFNIAEQAVTELQNIVAQQNSLSSQASSSNLTSEQRTALQYEVNALADQYNDILANTAVNGEKVFTSTSAIGKSLSVHAGISSANSTITGTVGTELPTGVTSLVYTAATATGTFAAGASYVGVTSASIESVSSDINGDGLKDIITTEYTGATGIGVYINNGDGTFRKAVSYFAHGIPGGIIEGDFNEDGKRDLVVADQLGGSVSFFYGNGEGSFKAPVSYVTGAGAFRMYALDMYGSGNLDIHVVNILDNNTTLLLGNGNGTFKAPLINAYGVAPGDITVGLFDGDSLYDWATIHNSTVNLVKGSVGLVASLPSFTTPAGIISGDLNGDGELDIIVGSTGNAIGVYLGNGDLTFKAMVTYAAGSYPSKPAIADINGDGKKDLISTDYTSGSISIYLGNGNGTFKARTSFVTPANPGIVNVADYNGDGFLDLSSANRTNGGMSVYLANTTAAYTTVSTTTALTQSHVTFPNAETAEEWANVFSDNYDALTSELGKLNATQSRLEVALDNASAMQLNFDAGYNRIMDIDSAFELANYTKFRILKDSGVAILAHQVESASEVLNLLG